MCSTCICSSEHSHTHIFQKTTAELWRFMFEVLCRLTDTHRFLLCTGGVHHDDLPDNLPEVREFLKSWAFFFTANRWAGTAGVQVCDVGWSSAGAHVKGGDTPVNHTHTKEEKKHRRRENTNPFNANKRQKLVHFRPKKETWNITQQQYGNKVNMWPYHTKPWWVESEPLATTLFWHLNVVQVTWSTHRFQHLSRSKLCPHVFQHRATRRRTMFHPSLVFLFTWN